MNLATHPLWLTCASSTQQDATHAAASVNRIQPRQCPSNDDTLATYGNDSKGKRKGMAMESRPVQFKQKEWFHFSSCKNFEHKGCEFDSSARLHNLPW
ncbi:hypothetical protein ElyMa_004383400 [Elysia marginata]|uniref:C3H1-type domain-containing protein n=1 Tax=Elysia marginata TaxID=1093978 RepID=A0AAV4HA50_9GAST|nr:hypothetical protein ElyMa_004383400 [Elysia marginata]